MSEAAVAEKRDDILEYMERAFERVRSFRQFRPKNDKLLVKKYQQAETTTSGGIIVPESAKELTCRGIVVAAGPGFKQPDGSRAPMDIEKGDLVVFNTYAGLALKVGEEEFVLIEESQIYGTVQLEAVTPAS